MGYVQVWFADYGKPQEFSSVVFPFDDLTAGTIAATLANITALLAVLPNVALGDIYKYEIVAKDDITARSMPADPTAQVETQWEVKYHTATSKQPMSLRIPTANLNKLNADSDNRADTNDAQISTYVTRFQAGVQADGENVLIDDIFFRPRRSARRTQKR